MPAPTRAYAPHYAAAPPTEEKLDYADLAIIDLSKARGAQTPEARAALAREARDAMTTNGFFYVVGHGYDEGETNRAFDIADVAFAQVGDEEKRVYAGRMKETGSYQGYKLRNYWHIDNGVHDQLEHYNINRDVEKKPHPAALRPFLPEIRAFAKFNHEHVLHEILRLLALGMEMPEETFVDMHGFDAVGETYVRYMKYYPRDEEEERKTNNVWLKGHTDFGTITILWSQPVSALQILSPDGKWRWIKHIPNALVINAGDAMEFLSGGFYKATIHRVVQPPPDQRQHTRLGVFYFAMSDDDVRLAPLVSLSPVLQRRSEDGNVKKRFGSGEAPTMAEWRKGRTAAYGQSELKKREDGTEVETIGGVEVLHYN